MTNERGKNVGDYPDSQDEDEGMEEYPMTGRDGKTSSNPRL